MPGLDRKPGGSTLVQDAGPGPSPLAPGKQTLTGALPPEHGPAAPATIAPATSDTAAGGARYDDMLASVLAAQPLTERAAQGDTAARAQVFQLLAPIEARLSQLNDHSGRLAQLGAGNIAGQAALDMAETAVRSWRQRLTLGTLVRTNELILRFRAGAEPIRFLTGEAKDAPTLREFNRVSGLVGAGAAAPVVAPAVVALAVSEAPLLAFAARGSASRVALWALHNPAAALAASEALLGYGIQVGEGGWEAFWSPLNDPQGRWMFLLQVLMDYMHVQGALHDGRPRPAGAAASEPPPDVDGARKQLAKIRQTLQHVDEAAEPYASSTITASSTSETPGGADARGPRRGVPAPDNPFAHVPQKEDNWCGAACGEMSARRLGVEISQDDLAGTSHFKTAAPMGPDDGKDLPGGFQTDGLLAALKDVVQTPGRKWIGGLLPQDLSKPSGLLTHLKGYLKSTQASIILRVEADKHWIIVDSVTPDDHFVIRDPAESVSTMVTAEELSAMRLTGQAVLSFPETKR